MPYCSCCGGDHDSQDCPDLISFTPTSTEVGDDNNKETKEFEKGEMIRASFFSRVCSHILDLIFLSVISAIGGIVLSFLFGLGLSLPLTFPLVGFIITLYYKVIYERAHDQSLGKRIMCIMILSRKGGKITISQALIRVCGDIVCFCLLGLPYLSALGRSGQGFHDFLADTVVVKAPDHN